MELKDQVCSYEQAVKIYELGLFLRANKVWAQDFFIKSRRYIESRGIMGIDTIINNNNSKKPFSLYYPAPDSSELIDILPPAVDDGHGVDTILKIIKGPELYIVMYEDDDSNILESFHYENLAESLAHCLIWLIENKHISVEEL